MVDSTEKYYKKMTQTPVAKLVIRLGIPTTISMLITSIYNMADTYFVGELGKEAQGSIGVVFTLQAIIQAVAFMLGHGSGTYVAKELANKDVNRASKYVSSAFFVGGTLGVIFAIVGLIFLTPLMTLLGSTQQILPYAKDYAMWVCISCPFIICSLILNNNLRYEGKSTFAMVGLCSGGLLNIALDYLFVQTFAWGVWGAGFATAFSQVVSFVILLVMFSKKAQSKLSVKCVVANATLYGEILRAGLPSLIRQGLNSISSGVLNNLARYYGNLISAETANVTIASMGIVSKITNFVMCVGLGIGQGLQPVASFNYQAKFYNRVKRATLVTCAIGFVAVTLLALPVAFFPQFAVGCFQKNAMVIQFGGKTLRYYMLGMLLAPIYTPASMLFQSIRKSAVASFLATLRNGLLFIPIILLACNLWGLAGIQIAQPCADLLSGLVSLPFVIRFFKTTPNSQPTEGDCLTTEQ